MKHFLLPLFILILSSCVPFEPKQDLRPVTNNQPIQPVEIVVPCESDLLFDNYFKLGFNEYIFSDPDWSFNYPTSDYLRIETNGSNYSVICIVPIKEWPTDDMEFQLSGGSNGRVQFFVGLSYTSVSGTMYVNVVDKNNPVISFCNLKMTSNGNTFDGIGRFTCK